MEKVLFLLFLTNQGFFCKNKSSLIVIVIVTRYFVIAQFINYLILISRIVSGSSVIFPSSLIFGKIVWTGTLFPMTFLKKETWKTRCTHEDGGNSNL
jgi:hypothetical protein